MHENDRAATGCLPPKEFEIAASQFFVAPEVSARGGSGLMPKREW